MKATGIVRRIDDLGRVVIPKEIRRTMRIREGDPSQMTLARWERFCFAMLDLSKSWINVEIEVEQSMQSYLDSLDEELSNQPGFKKPPTKIVRKCRTTSQTDSDSGYQSRQQTRHRVSDGSNCGLQTRHFNRC